MEKTYGFMQFERAGTQQEAPDKRISHFKEFEQTFDKITAQKQAMRCMDCGIPFCQGETGCPVDNLIPEFNDLVFRNRWQEALECLHSTNNFPEFTGRLCPAPCETACVLGIAQEPVSIKSLERAIIDHGFSNGWVKPCFPKKLSGKKIAIVGSGPAGLACAQQLARAGHSPTVFEKEARLGGLLRYGIPDFKMEKWLIDRRIEQLEQEGVLFKNGIHVGYDISAEELLANFDALVLALGAEAPIPLDIPGHHFDGVHYAMKYLTQANRLVAGDSIQDTIRVKNKNVIVIGGGDTGSDCIGVANRQNAKNIINFRRSLRPPDERPAGQPWPLYPDIFYISTSHEEGVDRRFAVRPLEILGNEKKQVTQLKVCHMKQEKGQYLDVLNSHETWDVDIILLAMGYRGPKREGLIEELVKNGLVLDQDGNVKAKFGVQRGSFHTSMKRVYACGDVRKGQSLIVWAISEGRKCAEQIQNDFLNAQSS